MKRLDTAPDGGGNQAGLCCPQCGHCRWRVLYTRAGAGRMKRRRECLACLHRVTTWEHIIGDVPTRSPQGDTAPNSPAVD